MAECRRRQRDAGAHCQPIYRPWQCPAHHQCSDSKSFIVFVNSLAGATLTPVSYVTGQFTVQINGPLGPGYIIQASTNLINWNGISTSTPSVLPFTIVDTNAATFPRRFYRAVLAP